MADNLTINTAPGLPEFEKRKTWETTQPGAENTTETTQQTPERAAADTAEDEAAQQEADVAARAKAQKVAEAQQKGVDAQAQADIASHQAADQDYALRSTADDIAKARARTLARQSELEKMDAPSLYGNTNGWGKVQRGVAIALGGLGDAIQRAAMVRIGHAPPTINTVGSIIERILDEQREHIGKLKDSVVQARTGEQDAVEARRQMLQDIDLRGAAMYKRAEMLASARLAAMGKSQAEIEGDANIAALRSKRAEKHAAYVAPLLDKITKKTEEATRKTGGEAIERAPTKATGASPTGATAEQSAALAKYVDEHPTGQQSDYVAFAKTLGIPDAQGEVTRVAGANSLPEKERERQTVDLEGKPVLAPSARNVGAVSEQVADTHRAAKAIDDLLGTIQSGSGIGNAVKSHIPGTDINSQREEVVGLMSKAMGLSMSDARQKLDEAIVGTGGVGLLSGGAEKNLQRLREQVLDYGKTKVQGETTPVRAPKATQPPPEAAREEGARKMEATHEKTETPRGVPSKEDQIADAKKWMVSPEARKDPAKRKRVYDKLKEMGVKF